VALEWVTIGFLASIVVVMYFAMGNSQAMKTAFWEDLLSFVPPVVFLVGLHVEKKPPSERFPFGRLNVATIAFLAAASALLLMGGFLLFDALSDLAKAHRPSIGAMDIGGRTVWAGWVMIGAVVYSMAPPLVLGWLKHTPARKLHDKTLAADADMNKADWMTGAATGIGVLGIGLGFWWTDAVAAAFVSLNILHDGFKNAKRAISDLMDQVPTGIDGERLDVVDRIDGWLRGLPWVEDADVSCRLEGRFIFVQADVAPAPGHGLPDEIAEATRGVRDLDWKIQHVVVSPVLDREPRRVARMRRNS
jgi:cation diffusion facilitator family transporter